MTRWVDPRGRGGARKVALPINTLLGRSPRARGSLQLPLIDFFQIGSIPAGAGEPTSIPPALVLLEVDPRGRGGASTARG